MDSLAARYERSKHAHAILEDEISDALIACGLALKMWSDWHYDYYDGSLTIEGCAGVTPEQVAALTAHGFSIIRTTS